MKSIVDYTNKLKDFFATKQALTTKGDKAFMPIFGTTSGRGAISNALSIDTTSADGNDNRVGYVYSGNTSNLPTDCSAGIREVFYYNSSNVFVKITGKDKNNNYNEWGNYYNGASWTGWISLTLPPFAILSSKNITIPSEGSISVALDVNSYKEIWIRFASGNTAVQVLPYTSSSLNYILSYYDGTYHKATVTYSNGQFTATNNENAIGWTVSFIARN